MKKHIFIKPKIEIMTLDLEDVITVSGEGIELPDDEFENDD